MSSSTATARTDWLNWIGNRLGIPRSNRFRSRWKLISRRNFAVNRTVATGTSIMTPSVVAESSLGLQQLPFKSEGYNYWKWRGYRIHYVVEGEGFPIVLIHGFASSSFHWRYNIPELAKRYKVYALDLLGFGWSEKPLIDYDALIWRDQVVDFLNEIVKQPAVLVGNSLGGFTTLLAAAALPDQVRGVSLLNSAGRFGDDISTTDKTEETALHKFIVKPVEEIFQRVVVRSAFWITMRPDQIEAVLKSGVYRNHSNVDDYLINSILRPAADPNAYEVYYRLLKQLMSNPTKYTLDSVLSQLSCPLLLLWGDLDPWVHDRAKPNQIKDFYPNTSLVNLQAGHYPQDEVPEQVNKALLDWLSTLASEI
ncbi:pheophytinase, chloroplastic-like [Solanum stenotomum]|uniref:pheophytinase, chloroplastic-like n=1 Tax=Solanum stenotomum TaxID=172797 RepID=UPI0020D11906|nr:pheophytinase, chloroplastic-like [Solanum stenotomum]